MKTFANTYLCIYIYVVRVLDRSSFTHRSTESNSGPCKQLSLIFAVVGYESISQASVCVLA